MPSSKAGEELPVYDRLVKIVFSGDLAPGTQLVERDLAEELGVSRIPVRESLAKMVAQGLLVGGKKWQGARVRTYRSDEIRQLYEFREMLEGGAARSAAEAANTTDWERLQMICNEAEAEIGNFGSKRWAQLDHHFHVAVADASHNERFMHSLRLLLTECFYVFYLPTRLGRPRPPKKDATARMRSVVEEHQTLVELIRSGDADGAEQKARRHMRKSGQRAARALIAVDLEAQRHSP